MRDVNINSERITPSLLISGATIALAYLVFLFLWSAIFDGKQGFLEAYEVLTQESKARRIHLFLMFALTFLVPVIIVPYGSLVYWILGKYSLLSYASVVVSSVVPSILVGVISRDYGIMLAFSYFCIWHSSISWWYVCRDN